MWPVGSQMSMLSAWITEEHEMFRTMLRKILCRALGLWILPPTFEHLQRIRQNELQTAVSLLPPERKLLEIGAGTGWQAKRLAEHGFEVSAVEVIPEDVETMHATYRKNQIFPIIDYDGHHLPFANETFDIVFSSSVLEHIPHDRAFQKEIHRVLKQDGKALHILPSTTWRFFSTLTFFIRRLSSPGKGGIGWPCRHGEKGSLLTEHYYFSRMAWKKFFRQTGWQVERIVPNRLFYTGECIRDKALSCHARKLLSYFFGSSCHLYVLRKASILFESRRLSSDGGINQKQECNKYVKEHVT
jgi:SAM-dependent methyltransferase